VSGSGGGVDGAFDPASASPVPTPPGTDGPLPPAGGPGDVPVTGSGGLPLPAGPVAGAAGFALLGTAIGLAWRRGRPPVLRWIRRRFPGR
jgi:hypothetical protein